MRRNLAEKLKQGTQRRARQEKLWQDSMRRREEDMRRREEDCCSEEEGGKISQDDAKPKFSPNATYQWHQGSTSAYTFQASGQRDEMHAESDSSKKPNTEYSYAYSKGEQRTWSTPGSRPASRGGESGSSARPPPPKQPPSSGPRFTRSVPKSKYPGTSAPDSASTAPPSPCSASSTGPQPRQNASNNAGSPKNAEATTGAGGFFGANQRRWGTSNWGRSGWGAAAGWNIPKPPPQPKQPSYSQSQWHSQTPPKPPPAVAAAVAAARTPAEASILANLETRLQELRRLPKEEQKKCSKELMVRWHPDKNPDKGDESTRIFQWLQNRKKELLGL